MPVKWAIKAVLVNDMEMLKDAIENRQDVYTVSFQTCILNYCCNINYYNNYYLSYYITGNGLLIHIIVYLGSAKVDIIHSTVY